MQDFCRPKVVFQRKLIEFGLLEFLPFPMQNLELKITIFRNLPEERA